MASTMEKLMGCLWVKEWMEATEDRSMGCWLYRGMKGGDHR